MKRDSAKVHGDLTVKQKVVTVDAKIGEQGFFEDKFGNKIYRTDSEENKARLAALPPPIQPQVEEEEEIVAEVVAPEPKRRGRPKKVREE